MEDIQRNYNETYKGKYRCFRCSKCGKESLLGNLAQRIAERNMPRCCGYYMSLVENKPVVP